MQPVNNGYELQIKQSADKAILNWQSFNIGAGSKVWFEQPGASAIALNRVTGSQQSLLEGKLSGNGQVWLLNPNGVLIGSGGSVDTRGFLATTRGLSDADFNDGKYGFKDSGKPGAMVINQGRITASDGGYAALAGEQVRNEGLIQADLGTVVLGGAKEFTVDLAGDRLLSFVVNTPVSATVSGGENASPGLPLVIENTATGSLISNGGRVLLTAQAVGAVLSGVINTQGLINADSVTLGANGQVVIDGGASGLVNVGGTVSASGLTGGLASDAAIAVSGGDLVVSGRLQKTGSATSSILLSAGGRVELLAGAFVGGADASSPTHISVLSNTSENTEGGIRIASGASLVSSGGNILLAGGKLLDVLAEPGNPDSEIVQLGFAANPRGNGVEIGGSPGFSAAAFTDFMVTNTIDSMAPAAALIDAGGGEITVRGLGGTGNFSFEQSQYLQGMAGVFVGNDTKLVTRDSGSISVTGYAQGQMQTGSPDQNTFVNSSFYKGVMLGFGALIETVSGAVVLVGKGGGNVSLSGENLAASAQGGIPTTLSGVSSNDNTGIELNGATIKSTSGDIALFGKGGGNVKLSDLGIYNQPSPEFSSADGAGSGFLNSSANHGIALFNSRIESDSGAIHATGVSGGSVHASGLQLGDSSTCALAANAFCNSSIFTGFNSGVLVGFDSLLSGAAVLVKGRSLADITLENTSISVAGSGSIGLIGNTGISVDGGRIVAANGGDIVLKGSSASNLYATGLTVEAGMVAPDVLSEVSPLLQVNSELNSGVSIGGFYSASFTEETLPGLSVTGAGNISVTGEGGGLLSVDSVSASLDILQAHNHGVLLGSAKEGISPLAAETFEVQPQVLTGESVPGETAEPVALESGTPLPFQALQADAGRIAVFAGTNDAESTDLAIFSGTSVKVAHGTVALRADSVALKGIVSGVQDGEQRATLEVAPRTVGLNMFVGDGQPQGASPVLQLTKSALQNLSGFGRTLLGGNIDSVTKVLQVVAGKLTLGLVGQGRGADVVTTDPITPALINTAAVNTGTNTNLTSDNLIVVMGQHVDVQHSFDVSAQDRILLYGENSLKLSPGVSVGVAGQLDLVSRQFENSAGSAALVRAADSQGVWRIWAPNRAAAGVAATGLSANGLVAEQEIFKRAFSFSALAEARNGVLKNSFIYAGAVDPVSPQDIVDNLPQEQQNTLDSTLTNLQQLVKPVLPPVAGDKLAPTEVAKPALADTASVDMSGQPPERSIDMPADPLLERPTAIPASGSREPVSAVPSVPSPLALASPEARSLPATPVPPVSVFSVATPAGRANTAVLASPPSPVGSVKPPTPKDFADAKDFVLATATPSSLPKPAQQAKRAATTYATTSLGTAGLRLASPVRTPVAVTMEHRFSLMGNQAAW